MLGLPKMKLFSTLFTKSLTYRYLAVTGRTYGSPIVGQNEVVGEYSSNSYSQWQAMEGLFIHPNDFKTQHYEHTEL